jgi:hypothetical protein
MDKRSIYLKACRLYSEGIQYQIDYELLLEKEESEENANTLQNIKESNQRLYELMKSLSKDE